MKSRKRGLFKILTRGLVVLAPIIIIGAVIFLLLSWVTRIIHPLSNMIVPGSEEPGLIINLISLVLVIAILGGIGALLQTKKGRKIHREWEVKFLNKVPLYSSINEITKRLGGMKEMPFSKVVLVDIYKTGTLMTAFIVDQSQEDLVTVFVPTAPNPMNGNIYHVPSELIQITDVTPQEAMQTIICMGAGTSKIFNKTIPFEHGIEEDFQAIK